MSCALLVTRDPTTETLPKHAFSVSGHEVIAARSSVPDEESLEAEQAPERDRGDLGETAPRRGYRLLWATAGYNSV